MVKGERDYHCFLGLKEKANGLLLQKK